MSEKNKKTLLLTAAFAAFVFLQFTVLRICNSAGEGYLDVSGQEQVYYALQVFVIAGFFAHAAVRTFAPGDKVRRITLICALAGFFIGSAILIFGKSSGFYLATAFAAVLFLGFFGGAVFEIMSRAAALGEKTGFVMGIGMAAAIALQFVLQIQWGKTALLPVFMLAAFVMLSLFLLKYPPEKSVPAGSGSREKTTPRQIVIACLIAAAMLFFASFYNNYIHRLQISSGYGQYNVYSWPRLMLIPCYLFFAFIGDKRQGKFVPVAALCIALAALLNSVLTGSEGAYELNMCLFYCAIAALTSYYILVFWRIAPGTRHPALWAPMGRVLDSFSVLAAAALKLSTLPSTAVLTLNIIVLAVMIVLMAINGDFNFSLPEERTKTPQASSFDAEERLSRLSERFGLTPKETAVLRELVLTEDKQEAIGQSLSIKKSTVQFHTTSIYRKTGASTRSGLCELFYGSQEDV